MFRSATAKLTVWYFGIIMAISLIFSFMIYQITNHEVGVRIEHYQTQVDQPTITGFPHNLDPNDSLLEGEQEAAARSTLALLFYINIVVLGSGGIASYYFAKRTLRPIEAAHEAQTRFTSDASHELRTPLTTMRTELELTLRNPDATKEELREVLQSNLEEVGKLSDLSRMLLDLSRLEYGKLEFNPVDLGKLTRETIDGLHLPKARVKFDGKADHIVVADRVAIGEVASILIDNALKYSPAKSVVNVKVSGDKHRAKLVVSNSGEGISPAALPHIFERFYRADSSRTSSKTPGFGLGLALAKQIIDLHDGEITATSHPGKTTTFTVLLPKLK
jgi:signal transduction histidine kinase